MNMKYIGMDIHKEAIVIAVVNGDGKMVMQSIIETKASTILQFFQGLRGELHVKTLKCVSVGCASMSLERVNLGKMNLQLVANEENQDRAQCGKNEASRMVPFVCRARKHVANAAADDRSDDAEGGCPEDRHMDVHHRFRDNPRD
jgi:hypothetical protein